MLFRNKTVLCVFEGGKAAIPNNFAWGEGPSAENKWTDSKVGRVSAKMPYLLPFLILRPKYALMLRPKYE